MVTWFWLRNLPLQIRKITEAKHVSGKSTNGDLERPLCDAVKVKPGLPWETQNVRDARVVGYLLRKSAKREWNHPRKGSML